YSGSAVDLFQGEIPAGSLSWKATLYPCAAGATCAGTVIHSGTGSNGTFTPPDAEYPSHIVLSLTATTFEGLTGTTSVTLTPRTTDLTFQTSPAGRRLFVDGEL